MAGRPRQYNTDEQKAAANRQRVKKHRDAGKMAKAIVNSKCLEVLSTVASQAMEAHTKAIESNTKVLCQTSGDARKSLCVIGGLVGNIVAGNVSFPSETAEIEAEEDGIVEEEAQEIEGGGVDVQEPAVEEEQSDSKGAAKSPWSKVQMVEKTAARSSFTWEDVNMSDHSRVRSWERSVCMRDIVATINNGAIAPNNDEKYPNTEKRVLNDLAVVVEKNHPNLVVSVWHEDNSKNVTARIPPKSEGVEYWHFSLARKEKQIQDLRDDNRLLGQQKNNLQDDNRFLEREVVDLQDDNRFLEQEVEDLQADNRFLERKVEELQRQLSCSQNRQNVGNNRRDRRLQEGRGDRSFSGDRYRNVDPYSNDDRNSNDDRYSNEERNSNVDRYSDDDRNSNIDRYSNDDRSSNVGRYSNDDRSSNVGRYSNDDRYNSGYRRRSPIDDDDDDDDDFNSRRPAKRSRH
jgi:hypothetical protein